eukprot:3055093-Heterocapsa_arctica.AAC.1
MSASVYFVFLSSVTAFVMSLLRTAASTSSLQLPNKACPMAMPATSRWTCEATLRMSPLAFTMAS